MWVEQGGVIYNHSDSLLYPWDLGTVFFFIYVWKYITARGWPYALRKSEDRWPSWEEGIFPLSGGKNECSCEPDVDPLNGRL